MATMNFDSSVKIKFQGEEDQPPKPKTKLRFIIYFIVIVTALSSAFTIWKSHLKSPSTAIQVACSRTLDHDLCHKSLLSLHKNTSRTPSNSITLSKVFTLSLQAGINELSDQIIPELKKTLITETNRWRLRSLKRCDNWLTDSRGLLNRSLTIMGADEPNEKIFSDANFTFYMEVKITEARDNIAACRSESIYKRKNEILDMKMKEAWFYADNSLRILYHRTEIHQELNPTIASLWNSLFMSGAFGMVLAYIPFVFLFFLVILFLRI